MDPNNFKCYGTIFAIFDPKNALLSGANSQNLNSTNVDGRTMPPTDILQKKNKSKVVIGHFIKEGVTTAPPIMVTSQCYNSSLFVHHGNRLIQPSAMLLPQLDTRALFLYETIHVTYLQKYQTVIRSIFYLFDILNQHKTVILYII